MNINEHLCVERDCIICHPTRKGDGGVDNLPVYAQAVDNLGETAPPVVDNSEKEYNDFLDDTVEGFPEDATWTEGWEESLYPESQVNGPFYYALFLERKLREARDLITWFSRKWGDDHDPLFPWRDEMTGQDLPGNRLLADTWYEVVRGGIVCEVCEGTRGKRKSTDVERVYTFDACEACQGQGFIKSEGL